MRKAGQARVQKRVNVTEEIWGFAGGQDLISLQVFGNGLELPINAASLVIFTVRRSEMKLF